MIFPHRHRYPDWWEIEVDEDTVIFKKKCLKCKKVKSFSMNILNVKPAYETYIKKKRSYK